MSDGSKPTDSDTLARIRSLVAEEKDLRRGLLHSDISESEEHERAAPARSRTRPMLGSAAAASCAA